MDVTDTRLACTLPADGQPGCGYAPAAAKGSRAAKAAIVAAGTAAACTACCVLPFTVPAVILANFGGVIAALDHAHGWVTWLAIAAVAGAWIWIWRQSVRARRQPTTSVLVMMVIASVVITIAISWPLIKPTVFYTLGIASKNPDKG